MKPPAPGRTEGQRTPEDSRGKHLGIASRCQGPKAGGFAVRSIKPFQEGSSLFCLRHCWSISKDLLSPRCRKSQRTMPFSKMFSEGHNEATTRSVAFLLVNAVFPAFRLPPLSALLRPRGLSPKQRRPVWLPAGEPSTF